MSRIPTRQDAENGFTLIELLVVVLIIGILAAIAIPVFLGQQNSARDGAAKSDIANAEIAIVSYYGAGNIATPTTATLAAYGFTQSTTAVATIIPFSAQNFCISVTSDSGAIYKLVGTDGVIAKVTSQCSTWYN